MKQTHKASHCKEPTRVFSWKQEHKLYRWKQTSKQFSQSFVVRFAITSMVEYQLAADPDILSRIAGVKWSRTLLEEPVYLLPTILWSTKLASRKQALFQDALIRLAKPVRREPKPRTEHGRFLCWKRTVDSTF